MLKRWWNNRRNSNGEMIVEKKEEKEEKEEETIVSYSYINRWFNIWLNRYDMIMHRLDYIPLKWNFVKERKYPKYCLLRTCRVFGFTIIAHAFNEQFRGQCIRAYIALLFHRISQSRFAIFRIIFQISIKCVSEGIKTRVRNAPNSSGA